MKNKIIIFGMVKSNLSMNAGPIRSLELDFLRIIYFLKLCSELNIKSIGYFVYFQPRITNRIQLWKSKYFYEFDNLKAINAFEKLNSTEYNKISNERKLNIEFLNSNAECAKTITEKIFYNIIKNDIKENKLKKIECLTFNSINWDYYCEFKQG